MLHTGISKYASNRVENMWDSFTHDASLTFKLHRHLQPFNSMDGFAVAYVSSLSTDYLWIIQLLNWADHKYCFPEIACDFVRSVAEQVQ